MQRDVRCNLEHSAEAHARTSALRHAAARHRARPRNASGVSSGRLVIHRMARQARARFIMAFFMRFGTSSLLGARAPSCLASLAGIGPAARPRLPGPLQGRDVG